jgi:hypothetical protein
MHEDLEAIIRVQKIDPHLRRVLLTLGDPAWGEPTAVHLPPEYRSLLRYHHDLHADSLFIGCFSTEWVRLQHNYPLALNNLPRGKRQAATGIKKLLLHLLNLAHAMWLQPKISYVSGTDHS